MPLEKRLYAHMHDRVPTRKGNWIRALKEKGLSPLIEPLESGIVGDYWACEAKWIMHFMDAGSITNSKGAFPRNSQGKSYLLLIKVTKKERRDLIAASKAAGYGRFAPWGREKLKEAIREGFDAAART